MQPNPPFTNIDTTEGQNGTIVITLRDEAGTLVEKAALTSITLHLYFAQSGETLVINGRSHQDVLDVNGGTYYDDIQTAQDANGDDITYNFKWEYEPDDTPFFRSDESAHQTEIHVAHFHFNWAGSTGGKGHDVRMTIWNFKNWPVSSP